MWGGTTATDQPKYPKIEALWHPKKAKDGTHDKAAATSDTQTSSSSSAELESSATSKPREDASHHHHHHLYNPLGGLIAALSFEEHPILNPFRKKNLKKGKSSDSTKDEDDDHAVKTSSLKDYIPTFRIKQHKAPHGSKASTTKTSPTKLIHRGTRLVDVSSSHNNIEEDSDVYFDAEQYGDLASDSFTTSPRESVVLQGITISPSMLHIFEVETEYNSDGQNNAKHHSPCVANKSDTDKILGEHENAKGTEADESFEYSEHEFHDRLVGVNGQSTSSTTVIQLSHVEIRSTTLSSDVPLEAVRSYNTMELIPEAIRPTMHPNQHQRMVLPLPPPKPSDELPLRFLRAGKNDPVEGLRRYTATLQMRKEQGIDTILRQASPDFDIIKKHYPHFCHGRGRNGEPCFYEQPPKTNLPALREAGVTLDKLLRHYTMVTEFQWQYLERDDLARSIYIIDLDGIRMTDFVGEAVDFVKKAAGFSAQHYPERAGYVFVINVPGWFKLIWNVLKPIIDTATLEKIHILRGKEEIRKSMNDRIPLENIPPEYGGTSVPLGQSAEEVELASLVAHNNAIAEHGQCNVYCDTGRCKFCEWVPARRY